jgi:amidophosphoribosyltransferase
MRSINEKCAVIGISTTTEIDVARLVYLGLWSLQHRGQDSSGIATFDKDSGITYHKKEGLVSQVYSQSSLDKLKGQVSIGHNRYSTSGGNDSAYNQPFVDDSLDFAFAHNGNLPTLDKLKSYLKEAHINSRNKNDTGMMFLALSNELRLNKSLQKAVKSCWDLFSGAFSCVGIYEESLFAFRDSFGIRPLAIGKLKSGYVVASETVALDIIGADFIRDVRPGELVIINKNKLKSIQIADGKEKIDAFEFVYLARPDSRIAGRSVYTTRYEAGKVLAKLKPVKADIVVGIPDSGLAAATGFAHQAGINREQGLLKNRYIGRTFIEPEKIRKSSVELKFNVIVERVAKKDIILVDDSLVRGNTLKYVIQLLKSYGAKKIHVRIASPPIKFPDYYGIDTPKNNDLIAAQHSTAEIQEIIGADSLEFLDLTDFIKSTGLPKTRLNLSSFNGEYPIEIPEVVAV